LWRVPSSVQPRPGRWPLDCNASFCCLPFSDIAWKHFLWWSEVEVCDE